jgi:type IV fimbrial biogenesis protein FimT
VLNSRGFSLIELMIGIAIVAIVMFAALPAFTQFLQNTQIRNAADSVLNGLTLARNEAVRRNTSVQFSLVNGLTTSCAVANTALTASPSLSWVVSRSDPSGNCNQAPSDTTAPFIVQTRSGTEGTSNARVTTDAGQSITFSGLGRVVTGGALTQFTQLTFTNTLGTCVYKNPSTGTMRCLGIVISSGGQIRMCDPQVAAPTPPDVDPRYCAGVTWP